MYLSVLLRFSLCINVASLVVFIASLSYASVMCTNEDQPSLPRLVCGMMWMVLKTDLVLCWCLLACILCFAYRHYFVAHCIIAFCVSLCLVGCNFRLHMMSDRLSGLTSELQTNIRPYIGAHATDKEMTATARPGLHGIPVTTLPQALQMMRNVQTSLDWVLNKQVIISIIHHWLGFYCY